MSSRIEFISHEYFPDDPYVREVVYLCFDQKFRIAYVRKESKHGGLFWSTPNIAVQRNGNREYLQGFVQDSNFLENDIKSFLEGRKWEKNDVSQCQTPIDRQKNEDFFSQDLDF